MMVFGVAFTLWKPMVEEVGPFLAVVSVRLLSTVFLGIYLTARRSFKLYFGKGAAVLVVTAAVLDSLGMVAFNLGIERNPVSLIIPIAAAYPAVTVALAWVLLKERMTRLQMAGMVAVLGGVITFSAAAWPGPALLHRSRLGYNSLVDWRYEPCPFLKQIQRLFCRKGPFSCSWTATPWCTGRGTPSRRPLP